MTISGGVLQIRVYDHHGITIGVGQASADRGLMTKVARQQYRLNARVVLGKADSYGSRAVLAAIVDEDDLQAEIPVAEYIDELPVRQ